MKSLIILSIFIFSPFIFADENVFLPEFTGEVKEFKSEQIKNFVNYPENIGEKTDPYRNLVKTLNKSVFQLRKGCSAVFTSKTGYAITALHCLAQNQHQRLSVFKKETLIDGEGPLKITTNVTVSDLEGFEFNNWDFNPDLFRDHEDLVPVTIVALGKGYPDIHKQWRHDDPFIINNSGLIREFVDDYAVIKLNKVPEKYKCIKTSEDNVEYNQPTLAAGFPVSTKNHQTYLTLKTINDLIFKTSVFAPDVAVLFRKALSKIRKMNNETWFWFENNQHLNPFYVAAGRVYKNYEHLKEHFQYPTNNDNEKLFDLITDENKYLVTTSFIKPGFSGGGLFNKKGELIGINSMQPSTPTFLPEKMQPLTTHVRVSYIKQELLRKFGTDVANEVFDCQ